MKTLTIAIALIAAAGSGLAHAADDHMIRPHCWEENKDGNVYRHCDVDRPTRPSAPPQVRPPAPEASYGPPPPPNFRSYAGPQSIQPRYYAPPPYYSPPAIVFGFGPFVIGIGP
jgi:hypothetical protein